MECNIREYLKNPNLLFNSSEPHRAGSPQSACKITDPAVKAFYDKLICFQTQRKGLKISNPKVAYLMNLFNPKDFCRVDILKLKQIYELYACKNCF